MFDWIKWGEIETAEMDYFDTFYIMSTVLIIVFISLASTDPSNTLSHLSLAIGSFGLLIAVYSIQSSTKKLTEMQVDYWNARGIDDNRKGAELYKQREYDKAALAYENAIDAFDKADKLDPLYAKSWSNRGNALVAQKKYDEAIEAFHRALDLDSQSSKTWINYGLALYEKGKAYKNQNNFLNAHLKHDMAIVAFDTAKEQDRELSFAWNGKGAALKDKGDIFKSQGGSEREHYRSYANNMYDGAIRCYNEAIELDQDFGSFWYNKAVALDSKGNYDDAIKAYDKAIELDPKNATFWLGKGNALKALGTYEMHERAIHAYDKAIEFDLQHLGAWNQKGNALFDLGNHFQNEGLQLLRSSLDVINIHDVSFRLRNSSALFRKSNYYYNEALKSYDMAIDINPRDGMCWSNKGNVFRLLGRTEEANTAITRARELGYTR